MATQWHPLFAHLMRILLDRWYAIETEVPISDLPREADILLIRRQGTESPPFDGIWSNLTDWNVVEFKGPSDEPEQDDLELLMAVGTGLTYRLNEQRLSADQPRLSAGRVSFWYLAPRLGETFIRRAAERAPFKAEGLGLWSCTVWGHKIWLLGYRETAVEQDALPFFLLDREQTVQPGFREMILSNQDLLQDFAAWFLALRPSLWEELRLMVTASGSIIDWQAVAKVADLDGAVRALPPERVIEILGVNEAVRVIGLTRVIESVGLPRVIESVGLPRVIESVDPGQLFQLLLESMPPEEVQELLKRHQQQTDQKDRAH